MLNRRDSSFAVLGCTGLKYDKPEWRLHHDWINGRPHAGSFDRPIAR
jgi:hypothetical protein